MSVPMTPGSRNAKGQLIRLHGPNWVTPVPRLEPYYKLHGLLQLTPALPNDADVCDFDIREAPLISEVWRRIFDKA